MKKNQLLIFFIIIAYCFCLFINSCGKTSSTIVNPVYKVTYNGNGGTGGSVPTDSNNYAQDSTVTVLGNTGSLIKINVSGASCRFNGWNTLADGSGTDYNAGSTFAIGLENVTLYAKWTPYTLRDIGPAGGLIFYIADDYSAGWRYMEAAPGDQSAEIQWSNSITATGADGAAVGTGNSNTTTIVGVLGTGTSYAARTCYELELADYSDWFLPSRYELSSMYTELKLYDVGDFTDDRYWSSTENTNSKAWYQRFTSSGQVPISKLNTYRVRAARAF